LPQIKVITSSWDEKLLSNSSSSAFFSDTRKFEKEKFSETEKSKGNWGEKCMAC